MWNGCVEAMPCRDQHLVKSSTLGLCHAGGMGHSTQFDSLHRNLFFAFFLAQCPCIAREEAGIRHRIPLPPLRFRHGPLLAQGETRTRSLRAGTASTCQGTPGDATVGTTEWPGHGSFTLLHSSAV
jgi:hypothetical protein